MSFRSFEINYVWITHDRLSSMSKESVVAYVTKQYTTTIDYIVTYKIIKQLTIYHNRSPWLLKTRQSANGLTEKHRNSRKGQTGIKVYAL